MQCKLEAGAPDGLQQIKLIAIGGKIVLESLIEEEKIKSYFQNAKRKL